MCSIYEVCFARTKAQLTFFVVKAFLRLCLRGSSKIFREKAKNCKNWAKQKKDPVLRRGSKTEEQGRYALRARRDPLYCLGQVLNRPLRRRSTFSRRCTLRYSLRERTPVGPKQTLAERRKKPQTHTQRKRQRPLTSPEAEMRVACSQNKSENVLKSKQKNSKDNSGVVEQHQDSSEPVRTRL